MTADGPVTSSDCANQPDQDEHNNTLYRTEPEKLVDVLSRIESERQRPLDSERRRFRRFVIRGEARLEPLSSHSLGDPHIVLLRDISYAGLGFLTDRHLSPETMWRLRFHHASHGTVFGSQPVVIRYCRSIQSNLYMVGAEAVMEPYLLSLLGVDDAELRDETSGPDPEQEAAEYRSPDALA
jgi:hypothetical protein